MKSRVGLDRRWRFVLPLLIACAGGVGFAAEPAFPLDDVRVESLQLTGADAEGLDASVRLTATARTTATLQYIVFDQVTINGLRITLPATTGPIHLREGQPVKDLPTLHARVNYRELESLEPLRRMVRESEAHVRGVLRARLELNLFQRILLRTSGPWAVATLDRQVGLADAANPISRMAAFAALTAAEPLWKASRAARTRRDAALVDLAKAAMKDSLVSVETRYRLATRDKQNAELRHYAVGFLLPTGELLAPGESIEPWIFDEAIAEAIHNKEVSVVAASVQTVARSLSSSRQFPVHRTEPGAVSKDSEIADVMSLTTHRPFPMRLRGTDGNTARLGVEGSTGAAVPIAGGAPLTSWQPAVVVAVRRGQTLEPSFSRTAVRWDGRRYQLRDRVDPDAFGSPIWTDAGVVGIVQDGNSGAAIASVRRVPALGSRLLVFGRTI